MKNVLKTVGIVSLSGIGIFAASAAAQAKNKKIGKLKIGFNEFTDSLGTHSGFILFADGVDLSKDIPVVVYLHKNGSFYDSIERHEMHKLALKSVHQKNAVVVAPLVPAGDWRSEKRENDLWLNELINVHIAKIHKNVNIADVSFAGVSRKESVEVA